MQHESTSCNLKLTSNDGSLALSLETLTTNRVSYIFYMRR